MTLQVWSAAVRRAATGWRDQSERLDGPRRNLGQADTGLLGSRVGPVAATFLTTWEERVTALGDRAERHADALDAAALDFLLADTESVARTQELLLWGDRDTPPLRSVGP
jgi:hypothetical protein